MLTQFVAAFDDIVIGRFNKNREEKDRINVRYVYAPKQRVLYDLVNENKTLTLPVVSVNVTAINRDENRVFNKLDGFYYQGTIGEEKVSRHIKAPVPINISLSVSVLTRYQTDMDQILSNFVPFCNPYVIISWKVPEKFSLSVDQEIRSEVLWNGDVNLNYPVEVTGNQKARVTADTSFTVKGWLFKDTDNPSGNIFFIDSNFNTETQLEYYDNFESLSGNSYSPPVSTGLESRTDSFEVSGSPFITDIFYNGVLLQEDLTIAPNTSGNVILNGYGFTNTQTVLFSTNNTSAYSNLTSISDFSRQGEVSGQSIPFTILNDNTILLNSPPISEGKITFIPLNKAGYDFSDLTYLDTLSGRGTKSTFIIVGDLEPPNIFLKGPSTININLGDSYSEQDARGYDLVDGEVPVVIYGDTVDDTSSPTTYTILYSAIDAAGNIGINSRTVNVVDNILPVVTLNGSSSINIECGSTYTELNATAVDNIDGALSVTVNGEVNTSKAGTYTIEYLATDAAGNTGSTTRTVIVEDTVAPVVTLNGSSSINVNISSAYTELGAIANDDCDGSVSVNIYGDTVNTNLMNTYTVLYSATDAAGNIGTNSRTIAIIDNVPPVVTLNGSSPQQVLIDSTYTELNATALDNVDGSLAVTVGGDTVDTSLSGSYIVTYSATDSSGNTGTNSRIVNVVSPLSSCILTQTFNNVSSPGTAEMGVSYIHDVAGSATPPSTGWTKRIIPESGASATYQYNLTEPTGYDTTVRERACLRGLAIHVDSTGNITDSVQYGNTSPNNLSLATLLTNAGLVPSSEGCYSYVFEFHGWSGDFSGYSLWASADDRYYIYEDSVVALGHYD